MEEYASLEFQEVKQRIASNCCFSLGKKMLCELVPSFQYLWVKRELQRTKEALEMTQRFHRMPFHALYDITDSIQNARRERILSPMELRHIALQQKNVEQILKYRKSCEGEYPAIDELLSSFHRMDKLTKAITSCINDMDEVIDDASALLKSVRKQIRQCHKDSDQQIQRFIAKHHHLLMDTITTTRNNRICVLVKISEKNSVRGFIHGESASGQTAYIEPESLLQINNRLQSLRSQEQEEIERILKELSLQVKESASYLAGNQETLAICDMTFAKAVWAKQQQACVPILQEQGRELLLKEARHPLLDADTVVANTYRMQPPYRSLLITGSNTGGKTVSLKIIGLFACMAQSGLPILCEQAILPFYQQIFVAIGDEQSLQQSLSTFSAHIAKMAYIIDHISPYSLVLLDELGNGTDPKEGECLAIAILEYLRLQGAWVVATTHYGKVKQYAKQKEDVLISSVAFDMETMQPTYRYQEGISGQSNAFAIAARYGLQKEVLAIAEREKQEDASDYDTWMEKLEQEQLAYQKKKEKLEQTLQDVQNLRKQLQEQKLAFEKEKTTMLQEIRNEYEQQLEATKEEAQEIIAELKQSKEAIKPHELAQLQHQLANLQQDTQTEEASEPVSIQVGDYVCIKKLNYHGEVLDVQKNKAVVLVNGVRMNTKLQDLVLEKKPAPKKSKEKGYSKPKVTSFSTELNVIGMHVQEATAVIDKYLDNAVLAKISTVRIIHGVGTGALRKGVHAFLKKHPKVESFRMGGQGEGGLGASVVTLKVKRK